jgi:hypothetical protein
MRKVLSLLLFALPLSLLSQGIEDSTELRGEAAFFFNTPSLPVSGNVFVPPYHPGLDFGIGGPFELKDKGRWEWSSNLGYYYHRLSHHGIHIRGGLRYQQTGERGSDWNGLSWEFALKAGYLHMLTIQPSYRYDEESSEYRRTARGGRSQFTFGLATGPSYRPPVAKKWEFFVNYRFWIQTPFVKQYVPILPNVAFHIGVRRSLSTEKSEK